MLSYTIRDGQGRYKSLCPVISHVTGNAVTVSVPMSVMDKAAIRVHSLNLKLSYTEKCGRTDDSHIFISILFVGKRLQLGILCGMISCGKHQKTFLLRIRFPATYHFCTPINS